MEIWRILEKCGTRVDFKIRSYYFLPNYDFFFFFFSKIKCTKNGFNFALNIFLSRHNRLLKFP